MARKLLGVVPNVGDSSNKEAPTSWITSALNLKLDKTGLSASTPLSYNSGTGALSIQAASTTQDGYLSSANFNTFNNKEGAITAGTTSQYWRGDKSWQDLPSAIRSTVLSGLVAGTNKAITATDSILIAFQNLQAQVNNKLGSTAQATDSDKLDGQHGSYYQTALGYTPLKNTTDTLTGDLTLSGGSLYLPATGFSGAGPIQSTVAVKFANATAAQEAYMLKLRLGGTWSILDSNDPGVGGIYASGNIKADGSFIGSGANLTSIPPAALLAGGSDGQVPVKSGTTWAWGNTGGLSLSSPLTGYSLGTDSTALSASDTLLQGFQKLQLQQNNAKTYTDNVASTIQPAALATAIGPWTSYTPNIAGMTTSAIYGRYRRVGDSIEVDIGCQRSGTSQTVPVRFDLPIVNGTQLTPNQSAKSYGAYSVMGSARLQTAANAQTLTSVSIWEDNGYATSQVGNPGCFIIQATNGFPYTESTLQSAGLTYITIKAVIPVAQWSTNINLLKDFTEYAYNSSSTTSDDIVSFAYGKTGTNIVAYAGTGFDVLTKRVRFNTPILDSDIILIEFYNGTNWIPQHFAPFTDDSTGYGVIVIPLNTTDVNVSFRAKPNPVEAWSAYTSWKWRVRKISNGNFAQGSPSYTTTVGNGSATTITVTHNLGTSDVDVAIWELTGNRRKVDSGVEIRTNTTNPTTQVDPAFASAPAVNSLRVTVFSNGGTASLTSELQEFVSCDGTESGAGTSANTTYTLNNPVYGPNGSNFPAVAISSTTSTTVTSYDLPFINDIQPTDVLILEVNAGNRGWVPLVSGLGLLSPYTVANGVHTGVMLDRPAGSTNRIRVRFSNAGTRPGAAYGTGADTWIMIRNDASGYRWRVRKISNGNFSQLAEDQYSYSEVATNKRWVNGKTIYRKVINFGTLPNANSKSVAHGVTGITAFVSVRAFSGGTPIPFVGGSPTDTMTLWVDFTHFSIWCAGNKSAATAIGIFEYTK